MDQFAQRPSLPSNISYRSIGEFVVILDELSMTYYKLNDTGSIIWNLIDGKRTSQEITTELSNIYSLEYDQIMHHLHTFISELVSEGLLLIS